MAKKNAQQEQAHHVVAVRLSQENYSILVRIWAESLLSAPEGIRDGRAGAGSLVQEKVENWLRQEAEARGYNLGGDAPEG